MLTHEDPVHDCLNLDLIEFVLVGIKSNSIFELPRAHLWNKHGVGFSLFGLN